MFIEKCAGRRSEAPLGAGCYFRWGTGTRSGHFAATELGDFFFSIQPINISPLAGRREVAGHRER